MQKIVFDAGETRHVRLRIHATNDEPFVIRRATWQLLLLGQVEDSGECLVEEHVIDCLISPTQKGRTYKLRMQYEIADEVLVEEICICVA